MGVLADHAHGLGHAGQGQVPQVVAVEGDGPLGDVVEAGEEAGQGGLARARSGRRGRSWSPARRRRTRPAAPSRRRASSSVSARSACRSRGRPPTPRRRTGTGTTRRRPRPGPATGVAAASGPGAVGDRRRGVEDLEDPVEADGGAEHVDLGGGQVGERGVQPGHVGGQGHDGADLQGPGDGFAARRASRPPRCRRRRPGTGRRRGSGRCSGQADAGVAHGRRPARRRLGRLLASGRPNSLTSRAPETLNRSVIVALMSALSAIRRRDSRADPAGHQPVEEDERRQHQQRQRGDLPGQHEHRQPGWRPGS